MSKRVLSNFSGCAEVDGIWILESGEDNSPNILDKVFDSSASSSSNVFMRKKMEWKLKNKIFQIINNDSYYSHSLFGVWGNKSEK